MVRSGMPGGRGGNGETRSPKAEPEALEALDRTNIQIDIRNVLPAILFLRLVHNSGDGWVEVKRGKDLARQIPGAPFAEFRSKGTSPRPPISRPLWTGSSAAEVGKWRELLERHHKLVRHELARARGH